MKYNSFQKDLNIERKFGIYLDTLYPSIKALDKKFSFHRMVDLENQYAGIDLILRDKGTKKEHYIDEKAQLHYLNKSLKTFTFEISYLKNNQWREGWFYDKKKKTQTYFLFTAIKTDSLQNFKSCRFISVNRVYLQDFLVENGLTKEKVLTYEKLFRTDTSYYNGEQIIDEIGSDFLSFHCSFSNLREQPINLKIKLDALLMHGLAYEFIPLNLR